MQSQRATGERQEERASALTPDGMYVLVPWTAVVTGFLAPLAARHVLQYLLHGLKAVTGKVFPTPCRAVAAHALKPFTNVANQA